MDPSEGSSVEVENGRLRVPHKPAVAFIEGDGTGRESWTLGGRSLRGPLSSPIPGGG